MNQQEAWQLVCEFVQDEGLRRHILAVGAAMKWYARQLGEDEVRWESAGILHDFDWEIHPNLNEHPTKGADILRQRGVDEELIRTILSHYSQGTGIKREKPIDFALLACDEITGLIIAGTLVRPDKNLHHLELNSIKKKWKDRRFAAGVDRDHVTQVTADFSRVCFNGQLELWTHIQNVLTAMQDAAPILNLAGEPP